MSSEIYSISVDTANGVVQQPLLIDEILDSSIVTLLIGIKVNGNILTITFISAISGPEKTTLDAVVAAHQGPPINETIEEVVNTDSIQSIGLGGVDVELLNINGNILSPAGPTGGIEGMIINADINTVINIDNNEIKAAAAIDTSKLANGTVSNTEFQYLNSVTSNVQTQINEKITGPSSSVDNTVPRYDGTTGKILQVSGVIIDDNDSLQIGNATTGTIAATQELVLRQDGDTFGPSILRLRNRNGENGAIFETTDVAITLVDFIFKTNADQRNIRYESRGTSIFLSTPEFQIGEAADPTLCVGDSGILIRGDATISGTFDGRDVSADGSTLDSHVGATIAHGVSSNIVGISDSQTLTNKTLTSPIISTISNTGTITLPTSTLSLVGRVPGASIDKGIVTFSGTGGLTIQGAGIRHYGASATDPTTPTPQAGDEYYNTAINHKMCYDASRGKWLSITGFMDGCGINGSVSPNSFYRRWNGMTLSTTLGAHIPKGTIVRIGYTTSNSVAHTLEVLVSGSPVAELASGGNASASSNTINGDFNAGNISFRNKSGSATATNLQAAVYFKLRA